MPQSQKPSEAAADAKAHAPDAPPQAAAIYRQELCEEVVAFMGEGYSLTAFAGSIGVSRKTLDGWIKAHPTFAAAAERGRAARTRFLETQFLEGGTGAKVAAHVFALKNAAPEDWRDRPEPLDGDKLQAVVITVPQNGRGDDDAG